MRQRVLWISKAPEFDERGEVVLGQCEPFTGGWRLVMAPPNGAVEELVTGAYSDLHRIMEACAGIGEPGRVRERVEELWKLQNASVTETVAVDFGAKVADSAILEPTKTGELPVPPDDRVEQVGDGFFELRVETGILVALVADPERAGELSELKKQLRVLLDRRPKGVVLDLSRIQNLASRAATELVVFKSQCEREEVGFGLCRLRQNVRRLFETLRHQDPPSIYPDIQAACAALLDRNA